MKIKHRGAIILLCIFAISSTMLNWGNRKMIPEDKNVYRYEWVLYTEYNDEYNLQDYTRRFDLSPPLFVKQLVTKYPKEPMSIIDGNGNIAPIGRTPVRHEYMVNAKSFLRLKENTNYFPGWTLRVNNKLQKIKHNEQNYRGKMIFELNPGYYHILFTFEDTPIRYYSKLISGMTLSLLLVILLMSKFIKIKYSFKSQ